MTASSTTPTISTSSFTPSTSSASPKRPRTTPKFQLFDEDVENHPPAPGPPTPPAEPLFPFLGALWPFVGDVCLREVGASSLPGDAGYLVWRVMLLVASITNAVVTIAGDVRVLAYVQGIAAVAAVLAQTLLLRRHVVYRRWMHDKQVLWTPGLAYSWDVFIVQTALHMAVMVPIVYAVNSLYVPADNFLSSSAYVGSMSSYVLLGLMVLQVVDVFVTPAPFRATYILPTLLYCIAISAVTTWVAVDGVFALGVAIVGLASFGTGLIIQLFSRLVFLHMHKPRIVAELMEAMEAANCVPEKV